MDFFSLFSGEVVGKMVESDLARQSFLFALAAWIHSGRVKKEIKTQFESLTLAITNTENKFTNKIDGLDTRVKVVEEALNKQGA